MNASSRHDFNDALSGNAATCEAIAERVEKYLEDDCGVGATEMIIAILALTEAIRILTRVQMYQD